MIWKTKKHLLLCNKNYCSKRNILWLITILLWITVLTATIALLYAHKYNPLNHWWELQALRIPELIDSREVKQPIVITAWVREHEFIPGIKSETLGYNGTYLGPTIKMYKWESTNLTFINEIWEETNVHGHGLHVNGDIDGNEMQAIHNTESWDVEIPIVQQASTNWYHPHLMGTTSKQVHNGLAGLYIIEDENSLSLGLPNDYGINDIPLIIQDRDFENGKMIPYPEQSNMDSGRKSTFVVNGTLNPELKVPSGLIRLRILNGANARPYELYLPDNEPFYKIATEWGFLETPVEITKLIMAPWERNEIVIDMSDKISLELMWKFYDPEIFLSPFFPRARVLQLTVDSNIKNPESTLAKKLNTIEWYSSDDVVQERNFRLAGGMNINGESMDMKVINFKVKKGDLEKWTVNSPAHPFHMHGVSFQILSINGEEPPVEERWWKDTIYAQWNAELLMRFNHVATEMWPYMYHCHILEHEDRGMMWQFTVE